jgi:hypothetical protein
MTLPPQGLFQAKTGMTSTVFWMNDLGVLEKQPLRLVIGPVVSILGGSLPIK